VANVSPDMSNIDFARKNEEFANELKPGNTPRKNWIVTIRFYSFLHYVEERLQAHGYNSRSHHDRKNNIRNCRHIDDKIRKIYRQLEDISRDARYECVRLENEDIEMSEKSLEEGKKVLGFSGGSSNHKYSM
jgi:hypothetical protein